MLILWIAHQDNQQFPQGSKCRFFFKMIVFGQLFYTIRSAIFFSFSLKTERRKNECFREKGVHNIFSKLSFLNPSTSKYTNRMQFSQMTWVGVGLIDRNTFSDKTPWLCLLEIYLTSYFYSSCSLACALEYCPFAQGKNCKLSSFKSEINIVFFHYCDPDGEINV